MCVGIWRCLCGGTELQVMLSSVLVYVALQLCCQHSGD